MIIPESLETALRNHSPVAVFNQYRHLDDDDASLDAPAMRLANLSQHLNCQPRFILIGEAPGYHGCHFSGVPFTSEAQIMAGRVPRVLCDRLTKGEIPRKEASATVMWGVLTNLGIQRETVLFNAYPWHPYKFGNMKSNRAPHRHELIEASHVLRMVLELPGYDRAVRVAVGKVAERTLKDIGIEMHHVVRHPSMGGANIFRLQMQTVMDKSH